MDDACLNRRHLRRHILPSRGDPGNAGSTQGVAVSLPEGLSSEDVSFPEWTAF